MILTPQIAEYLLVRESRIIATQQFLVTAVCLVNPGILDIPCTTGLADIQTLQQTADQFCTLKHWQGQSLGFNDGGGFLHEGVSFRTQVKDTPEAQG